jgi:hypothetical protein
MPGNNQVAKKRGKKDTGSVRIFKRAAAKGTMEKDLYKQTAALMLMVFDPGKRHRLG